MDQPQLQVILKTLADNVYFQTPPNVTMKYPAIRYEWDDLDTQFANNAPYRRTKRYQVTVIAREPDSDVPMKVAALPMCTMVRRYIADNLVHTVFSLYF